MSNFRDKLLGEAPNWFEYWQTTPEGTTGIMSTIINV
jgi:hypothetical protein